MSCITRQPPAIVYQSRRNESDALDSTSRMVVDVLLSSAAQGLLEQAYRTSLTANAVTLSSIKDKDTAQRKRELLLTDILHTHVSLDLLHHDLSVPTFFKKYDEEDEDDAGDADEGYMALLSPPNFEIEPSKTTKGVLHVSILPRTLPISSTHAGKPFRIVLRLNNEEFLVSTCFHVFAKEPSKATQGPRPRGSGGKKRKRAGQEGADASVAAREEWLLRSVKAAFQSSPDAFILNDINRRISSLLQDLADGGATDGADTSIVGGFPPAAASATAAASSSSSSSAAGAGGHALLGARGAGSGIGSYSDAAVATGAHAAPSGTNRRGSKGSGVGHPTTITKTNSAGSGGSTSAAASDLSFHPPHPRSSRSAALSDHGDGSIDGGSIHSDGGGGLSAAHADAAKAGVPAALDAAGAPGGDRLSAVTIGRNRFGVNSGKYADGQPGAPALSFLPVDSSSSGMVLPAIGSGLTPLAAHLQLTSAGATRASGGAAARSSVGASPPLQPAVAPIHVQQDAQQNGAFTPHTAHAFGGPESSSNGAAGNAASISSAMLHQPLPYGQPGFHPHQFQHLHQHLVNQQVSYPYGQPTGTDLSSHSSLSAVTSAASAPAAPSARLSIGASAAMGGLFSGAGVSNNTDAGTFGDDFDLLSDIIQFRSAAAHRVAMSGEGAADLSPGKQRGVDMLEVEGGGEHRGRNDGDERHSDGGRGAEDGDEVLGDGDAGGGDGQSKDANAAAGDETGGSANVTHHRHFNHDLAVDGAGDAARCSVAGAGAVEGKGTADDGPNRPSKVARTSAAALAAGALHPNGSQPTRPVRGRQRASVVSSGAENDDVLATAASQPTHLRSSSSSRGAGTDSSIWTSAMAGAGAVASASGNADKAVSRGTDAAAAAAGDAGDGGAVRRSGRAYANGRRSTRSEKQHSTAAAQDHDASTEGGMKEHEPRNEAMDALRVERAQQHRYAIGAGATVSSSTEYGQSRAHEQGMHQHQQHPQKHQAPAAYYYSHPQPQQQPHQQHAYQQHPQGYTAPVSYPYHHALGPPQEHHQHLPLQGQHMHYPPPSQQPAAFYYGQGIHPQEAMQPHPGYQYQHQQVFYQPPPAPPGAGASSAGQKQPPSQYPHVGYHHQPGHGYAPPWPPVPAAAPTQTPQSTAPDQNPPEGRLRAPTTGSHQATSTAEPSLQGRLGPGIAPAASAGAPLAGAVPSVSGSAADQA